MPLADRRGRRRAGQPALARSHPRRFRPGGRRERHQPPDPGADLAPLVDACGDGGERSRGPHENPQGGGPRPEVPSGDRRRDPSRDRRFYLGQLGQERFLGRAGHLDALGRRAAHGGRAVPGSGSPLPGKAAWPRTTCFAAIGKVLGINGADRCGRDGAAGRRGAAASSADAAHSPCRGLAPQSEVDPLRPRASAATRSKWPATGPRPWT